MKSNSERNGGAAVAGGAPCSVERTSRSVIEHKLLTALDDKDKVAILATKQDLKDIIFALTVLARSFAAEKKEPRREARYKDLAAGMRQLLSEAFPLNESSSPATPEASLGAERNDGK